MTPQHKEKLNAAPARGPLLALAFFLLPALASLAGPRSRRFTRKAMFASHWTVLFAMLWPNARLLHNPVCRFRPKGREVWLTIDDGPCPETVSLATALTQRGVPATFFLIGTKLNASGALPTVLESLGHEVANHTLTHPKSFFWALPRAVLHKEISGCTEALQQGGARHIRCFRSPVGMANAHLAPLLDQLGLRAIGWTTRALDGVQCNPHAVIPRMVQSANPGAILLMHEGKNDAQGTASSSRTVLAVVDELLAQGFKFVIPDADQWE